MTEFVLSVLNQYPWLIGVILAVIILMLALFLWGVIIQGRSFTTPLIGMGSKESKPQKDLPAAPSILINNINNGTSPKMSDEDFAELVQRLKESDLLKEKAAKKRAITLQPEPPETAVELFKMQYAIEEKIREAVVSVGGGWAGASWAPHSVVLNHGVIGGIINEELLEEISHFHGEVWRGTAGQSVPEESVARAQVIGLDITRQLENILRGSSRFSG